MSDELRYEVARALGWELKRQPYGLDTWTAPDGFHWAETPDWPGYINEAFQLITADFYFSLHNEDRPLWHADIWTTAGPDSDVVTGSGETAAIAICRAWLAWKNEHAV